MMSNKNSKELSPEQRTDTNWEIEGRREKLRRNRENFWMTKIF